jgi:hypothetical protein
MLNVRLIPRHLRALPLTLFYEVAFNQWLQVEEKANSKQ